MSCPRPLSPAGGLFRRIPGQSSPLLGESITIAGASIIRARAFKKEAIESDVVEEEFVLADSTRNGMHFAYYEGDWKGLPDVTQPPARSEDYAFGFDPALVKQRRNGFAVAYAGYLAIPTSGPYSFALTSCDGSRLLVEGRVVIDNDGQHAHVRKER